MKVKLEVEIVCNGSMQFSVTKELLEHISLSIQDSFYRSPHNTEKNIIVNKVTYSEFDETLLEKDAAIYLNMSYKTLRNFRQRGLAPISHKEGRSFYYKRKDLEHLHGKCQFEIQRIWESQDNT